MQRRHRLPRVVIIAAVPLALAPGCKTRFEQPEALAGRYDVEVTQRLPGREETKHRGTLTVTRQGERKSHMVFEVTLPVMVAGADDARAVLPAATVRCEGDAKANLHVLRSALEGDEEYGPLNCEVKQPCVAPFPMRERTFDLKREVMKTWLGKLNLMTRWTCEGKAVEGIVVTAVTVGNHLPLRLEQQAPAP
ncbi:MAG: hypothetical protein KC731_00260 [Myxococcales bacterium]|nr:hypothetical protein [Myxococcales bacterium]